MFGCVLLLIRDHGCVLQNENSDRLQNESMWLVWKFTKAERGKAIVTWLSPECAKRQHNWV